MKVSVDNTELFTLSEVDKKIIQNDINADEFDADIKRRIQWIIVDEKLKKCYERLRKEWEPKLLEKGITPSFDKAIFAQQVFTQPDYKDRKAKDLESKAALEQMAKAHQDKPVTEETIVNPF
ncbi:MAG: hypothetical protein EKK56_00910 [Flavobacteriaceae bacterium]|nr:MAG: hypothetical protein EKK56_00910 [Flavobacteriaceae bacterium]